MKRKSYLTKEEIDRIHDIESLGETDESFAQSCVRFGDLFNDEEYMTPVQVVLLSFCEDNPKITEEAFKAWYQGLIDDEVLFKLDKHTDALLKDVRVVFDAKMSQWMAEGALNSSYNTDMVFWGFIGITLHTIYEKMGCYKLDDKMFFKDPMFGKFKIVALDYADHKTLNSFDNPHSYNRYDVESLIVYAMGGFDEYEDYRKTREIYQDVQKIVYDDPNRLLGDTKKILEQAAKHDKQKGAQYAVLYAAAVIEWYLKNKK